jgi:hypothetical protein
VVDMEVQTHLLLMKQNSISTRNLRGFTYQHVLARLSSPPMAYCSPFLLVVDLLMSNVFFQHFQRDIVRGVEGYIVTGSKQVEIGGMVGILMLFLYYHIY